MQSGRVPALFLKKTPATSLQLTTIHLDASICRHVATLHPTAYFVKLWVGCSHPTFDCERAARIPNSHYWDLHLFRSAEGCLTLSLSCACSGKQTKSFLHCLVRRKCCCASWLVCFSLRQRQLTNVIHGIFYVALHSQCEHC